MLLSVIIPAYNESRCIGETLRIALDCLERSNWKPFEVIVSDDASTDGTGDIARSFGVKVVASGKRNIGATRNVGAAAASGEFLLFLDADTKMNPPLLQGMENAFGEGAIGGGALVQWSEPSGSFWADRGVRLWNRISKTFKAPAGSFFFMRRDAYEKVGGFDEEYFVSEELHLGRKLKKLGRLAILDEAVATSSRKIHQFSLREHLVFLASGFIMPWIVLRNRKYLDIWYTRRS